MIEYFAGFATCAVIWAAWHFGVIQPRIKALKDLAEVRLKKGVEEFKSKF